VPKSAKYLQTHQLDNGLRLLLQPNPTSPSVALVILVGVGSRYENQHNNGIAHFLEHMAFKGTAKRPTTLDIAAEVDRVGGESNAFTSKEYTGYYIKVAAKDLTLAIDLLEDMLWHSTYRQAECDRERKVIIEEINMYRDSPRDQVADIYEKLLYPNQPLGMEVTGTPDSLAAIGHSELLAFNHQWYVPNNLVIGAAGQFDQAALIDQLTKAFGGPQAKPLDSYQATKTNQSKPQLVTHHKDTDQTQLIVGWRSFPANHPQRYALALLNVILGGNMSSRLFTQVREKRGLAYAVHSSVDDYLDAGSIVCQAGLGHHSLPEATQVILDQFMAMGQKGPTAQELTHAKQYLRGRLALSMEDGLSVAIFHGRQWLLEGQVRTFDDIIAGIDSVDLAQATAVANQLFVPSGLNVAVIGPQVDESKLQQLLAAA
jgi:predicted Zn-dependent peptidase